MSGHFLLLLGIAVGAGVITAISLCVFPVLPILFAGGGTGGRRRPVAIIAGLVASFATFTLFATWILNRLGLPQDLLRNLGIALLFVLAATLIFPQLGVLLERPLYFLSRRRTRSDLGGGFLLGASLGLVFVPCAGPVLGAGPLRLAHDPRDRLLLAGHRRADARDRLPGRGRHPAAAGKRRAGAVGARSRDGASGARDRLQRRSEAADLVPRLHGLPPVEGRAQLGREQGAGEATAERLFHRRSDRSAVQRHRHLDQLPAAHAREAPREGRPRRLLDVFLHQLPAHAAAPGSLGQALPQGWARDRRRSHAGVRLRARGLERS